MDGKGIGHYLPLMFCRTRKSAVLTFGSYYNELMNNPFVMFVLYLTGSKLTRCCTCNTRMESWDIAAMHNHDVYCEHQFRCLLKSCLSSVTENKPHTLDFYVLEEKKWNDAKSTKSPLCDNVVLCNAEFWTFMCPETEKHSSDEKQIMFRVNCGYNAGESGGIQNTHTT